MVEYAIMSEWESVQDGESGIEHLEQIQSEYVEWNREFEAKVAQLRATVQNEIKYRRRRNNVSPGALILSTAAALTAGQILGDYLFERSDHEQAPIIFEDADFDRKIEDTSISRYFYDLDAAEPLIEAHQSPQMREQAIDIKTQLVDTNIISAGSSIFCAPLTAIRTYPNEDTVLVSYITGVTLEGQRTDMEYDTTLVFDDQICSAITIERSKPEAVSTAAFVVAHEIAHHDGVLNEGLANCAAAESYEQIVAALDLENRVDGRDGLTIARAVNMNPEYHSAGC